MLVSSSTLLIIRPDTDLEWISVVQIPEQHVKLCEWISGVLVSEQHVKLHHLMCPHIGKKHVHHTVATIKPQMSHYYDSFSASLW